VAVITVGKEHNTALVIQFFQHKMSTLWSFIYLCSLFQVCIVVKIHNMVWVRTLSSLVDGYQYFRETYFLSLELGNMCR
jgi:hypothetical protein